MLKDIITEVQNVGFPIVIAIYLLVRMEAKLDQLTTSITTLSNVVERVIGEKK